MTPAPAGGSRGHTEPDYASPEAWASGPDRVYEALSVAVIADHASAIAGRRVLDIGAGTGATGRALAAAGATTVELDASWLMLAHGRRRRPPAVVADGSLLPFGVGAVGATVAAFVLSHVPDPLALLREAARVTAAGGPVVVVGFAATGSRSPVADVVDRALRARGWTAPSWHRRLKEEREPAVADPGRLRSYAEAAGLVSVVVGTRTVDTGVERAEDLVDWRLGMPAAARFVATLPGPERAALRAEAVAATGGAQRLVVDLRVLSSRSPAASRNRSA